MRRNPYTDERWLCLFLDLIRAGWTVNDILEGYGLSLDEVRAMRGTNAD